MTPAPLAGFYERTRSAKRIVVVDLGFLGDSVHLAPALWEIKRHYPDAVLHTVSAPVGAAVLAMLPCVDRAWAFPLGAPSPPWWRHGDIIRALRRERFDLALSFGGADRSIFLTALTGARWRAAHAGGRDHFWNGWLIPTWVPRVPSTQPVFEQRRQVLSALGFTLEPARFGLQIPDDAVEWARRQAAPGGVHLSINASNPLREWPLEHWAALARLLLRAQPARPLLATAGAKPRELERLEMLARQVDDRRLVAFTTPPTLPQLAALLASSSLHVGADSGVLHLAMAVQTPTLALFRQHAGLEEWRPRGTHDRHICAPCACVATQRVQPECASHSACLARITPEEVAAHVLEMVTAERG